MDETEGSGARAREGIGVCGRAAPLVAADVEGGAWAPDAVDSEVGGCCVTGALAPAIKGALAPEAEVSTSGGIVLAEASANFEAII